MLNKKFAQIRQANWEGKKPFYQSSAQEANVQLLPDPSINPGKFKPHPTSPHCYLAHPTTIRAVKKDMLLGGEDFLEFAQTAPCPSCRQTVDQQFWHFCPFCESRWEKKD